MSYTVRHIFICSFHSWKLQLFNMPLSKFCKKILTAIRCWNEYSILKFLLIDTYISIFFNLKLTTVNTDASCNLISPARRLFISKKIRLFPPHNTIFSLFQSKVHIFLTACLWYSCLSLTFFNIGKKWTVAHQSGKRRRRRNRFEPLVKVQKVPPCVDVHWWIIVFFVQYRVSYKYLYDKKIEYLHLSFFSIIKASLMISTR